MMPVFGPASVALGSSLAMSMPSPRVRAACMMASAGTSVGRVGHVGGGDEVELAAEDALVGGHRLAARADEEEVRAERHGFLQGWAAGTGRTTEPAAPDHRSQP